MKNFLVAIVSEGLFSVVALLVVCALIWFGGDYLGYPPKLRILAILAVLAAWLVLYLIQRALAVRRAMRIEAMLRNQAAGDTKAGAKLDPLAVLAHRFQAGLTALRATREGARAVRTMPWLLVMGPTGSGKTSALRESGLNFPFVGLGQRTDPTAGATRAIDFWYADRAVFLDTAGAYIADPARRPEWLALAKLLRRTKRPRPVDGVILTVSIAELLALPDDRVADHAQLLRDRIDELAARLGQIFPLYLVFTHCDRLHGFTDFFAHLSAEDRIQGWGCSFDWRDGAAQGLQTRVETEFDRLYRALDLRRIEALAEADASSRPGDTGDRQRNALLFPIQFALIQRRVSQFVTALGRPNPFQESGRLRAMYFTSAAQGGTPVDRVMASIGLSASELPALPPPSEPRAYFLHRLLGEIIPADHGLARPSARAIRRHRLAVAGLAAVTAVGTGAAVWHVQRGFVRSEAALAELAAIGPRLAATDPASLDGAALATQLAASLDRIEFRADAPLALQPALRGLGTLVVRLRGEYLTRCAHPVFNGAATAIARDLATRLASPVRTLADERAIEDRLRVYLMLCGRIPLRGQAVIDLLTGINGARFGDPEVFRQHLALIATTPTDVRWMATADGVLIAQATNELRDALWIPLIRIEIARAGNALYPAVDLEALLNGRKTAALTIKAPVPGILTQAAWDAFVAHAIDDRAHEQVKRSSEIGIEMVPAAMISQLRTRHVADHAQAWRELLANLQPQIPSDLEGVTLRLGELGAANSPWREAIVAWLDRRTLRLDPVTAPEIPAAGAPAAKDAGKIPWLDRCVTALEQLHAAHTTYTTTCPAGSRLANPQELDRLMIAHNAFAQTVAAALAEAPEDLPKPVLRDQLVFIAASARVALERELLLESVASMPGLEMRLVRADLAKTLVSTPIQDYPVRWREVAAAVRVPATADAVAAAGRLAQLTAPQSPLLSLFRAAWRGQRITSGAAAVGLDQEWVNRLFKPLATLAGGYAQAVAAEPGPRITRTSLLREVAESFTTAERETTAVLANLGDPALRDLLAAPLAVLLQDAQLQLRKLLAADANAYWVAEVVVPFRKELAGRFPFVADPAQPDAEPKAVAAFLAPKTGRLWQVRELLTGAAGISLQGKPLLRLTADATKVATAGEALATALFPVVGSGPAVELELTIHQREGVFQAQLAVGKETLDLHDLPSASRTAVIDLSEPLACRIAAQGADGRWRETVAESQPWSLLRWARNARPVLQSRPQGQGPDGLLLTWALAEVPTEFVPGQEVAPPKVGTLLFQLNLGGPAAVPVVGGSAFAALDLPALPATGNQPSAAIAAATE